MTAEDLLGSARALFHAGDTDGAVRMFLRARAFEEAAACLARANRYADAAQLLMDSLGVPAQMVGGVSMEQKKLAARAAQLFALAGNVDTSTKLYLALGDLDRAAAVFEHAGDLASAARLRTGVRRMSGQIAAQSSPSLAPRTHLPPGDAARAAEQLGRLSEAAKHWDEAGQPYDAARCWLTLGDTTKGIDALVRVPRDHEMYRAACVQTIRLAIDLNAYDFRIDQFVSRFVGDGPKNDPELETFYLLGKMYSARDFAESAVDVWRKILAVRPGYRDVQAKLEGIEDDVRGSSKMALESIVRDDAGFHGRSLQRKELPELAALPDLPDLPPLEPSTKKSRGAVAPDAPPPPVMQSMRAPIMQQRSALGTAVSVMPESQRKLQEAGTDPDPAPFTAAAAAPPASGPFAPENLPGGCIIAERYRIESKIGMGGMAAVYKAHDEELGESVAMKVFFGQHDATLLARFKQEVSLSRQLAHPNVVRLYDLGTHEGYKFLTMELLEGQELRAQMLRGIPLDLTKGINYLVQACEGLAIAHERGIIHRDLKPENLFVTKNDVLKVMDFGIAKGKRPTGVTIQGFIAGTPTYMAPEQIRDFGSVNHLADLYAIGVIAYEMFCGRPPFVSDELMGMLALHITEPPVPPKERNPDIPDELEEVVLRLLEKEPQRRVPSCRDLSSLLREIRPQSRRR